MPHLLLLRPPRRLLRQQQQQCLSLDSVALESRLASSEPEPVSLPTVSGGFDVSEAEEAAAVIRFWSPLREEAEEGAEGTWRRRRRRKPLARIVGGGSGGGQESNSTNASC